MPRQGDGSARRVYPHRLAPDGNGWCSGRWAKGWEVEQAEREVLETAERLARETYEARRAFLLPPDATPLLTPVARLTGARSRRDNP